MDDYTHRMLMNKLIDLPVTRAREERASEKHQWDIEDRGDKEAEKMFELFKTNVAAGSQEILQSGDSSGIDAMITALDTRLKVYDEAIAAKKPIDVSPQMVHHYRNMRDYGKLAKSQSENQWEVDKVLDDLELNYAKNIVGEKWNQTRDGKGVLSFLKEQENKLQGFETKDLDKRLTAMISKYEDKKKLEGLFDYFDEEGNIEGLQFYKGTESGRALNDKGQSEALQAYSLAQVGDIQKALEHMNLLEFVTAAGKGAALAEILGDGEEAYGKLNEAIFKTGATVYNNQLSSVTTKYNVTDKRYPLDKMDSEVAELMKRTGMLNEISATNQSIEGLSENKREVMSIMLKMIEQTDDYELPSYTEGDMFSMDDAVKTFLNDFGLWVYREEEANDGTTYMVDSPRGGFEGTHRNKEQESKFSRLMAEKLGKLDFNEWDVGITEFEYEEHQFLRDIASLFINLESTIHEAEALPNYKDAIIRGNYDPNNPMSFFSTAQFEEVLKNNNITRAIDKTDKGSGGGDAKTPIDILDEYGTNKLPENIKNDSGGSKSAKSNITYDEATGYWLTNDGDVATNAQIKAEKTRLKGKPKELTERTRYRDTKYRDYVRSNIKMSGDEMDKFRKSHLGGKRNPEYLKLPEKYAEQLKGSKWEKYHGLF